MDNATAEKVRTEIDKRLDGSDRRFAIIMAHDLFNAFLEARWLVEQNGDHLYNGRVVGLGSHLRAGTYDIKIITG